MAEWLGSVNLLLLGFNMLPAPLDGGRGLRAALWRRTGDFSRATRVAGRCGRGFGRTIMVAGLLLVLLGAPGGLWLAAVGWFLTTAARAESQLADLQSLLGGATVHDAIVAEPVAAPADITPQAFVTDIVARHPHTAYPVTADGVAVGEILVQSGRRHPAARPARAART